MRPLTVRMIALTLVLAGLLLGMAAILRDPEYDEGYTAFVTGTTARPVWPKPPFRVGDMRAVFRPAPAPWAIAGNLLRTDVHPPLYFWTVWAWRRLWGPDLTATRFLSVSFSLAALTLVAAIAVRGGFPVILSLLLTLGCYGFVETGIVARGFALAQCLLLLGLLLTMMAGSVGRHACLSALAAGIALGAACFTNYLAAFPAAAALVWLGLRRPGRASLLLLGLLPFLAGDLVFFLAQRNSRIGQFPPLSPTGMAAALAHAVGGAVLGGLPLYVPPGAARRTATILLALTLIALLLLPALRWHALGQPASRLLLAMAALATPLGLLAMGLASDTIPVEIRYLAFGLPPFAILLAASLRSLPIRARMPLLAGLAAVQGLSVMGLMTRQETMQPEGAAARAAYSAVGETGLVLLPRGNDGVGIVSAFLSAAPAGLHILLVDSGTGTHHVKLVAAAWPKVTVAQIAVDHDSVLTLPLLRRAAGLVRQMR